MNRLRTIGLEEFSPEVYITEAVNQIQEEISSDENVLVAASGGVDSTTVAALIQEADREVNLLHGDTGGMRWRKGEGKYTEEEIRREESLVVVDNLERIFGEGRVVFEDWRDSFFQGIFGVRDAEEKRKAFRQIYKDKFQKAEGRIPHDKKAQGTIKPDIEETDANLKTQNNPRLFKDSEEVRPLIYLDKPKVRAVAKGLGLPGDIYKRQPFLGLGLFARTVGEVWGPKLAVEKASNLTLEQVVEGLEETRREIESYGVAMRIIESEDARDAIPTSISLTNLRKFAGAIDKATPESVNAVFYDVTSKPSKRTDFKFGGTVEYE